MASALHTFWRILARHWIALAAWYLAGEAAHRLLVQLAGFVGGHTTLGGLLLLPLAVAARLIAYIAMYLTVRPSLPHARLEPSDGARSGYREFAGALLVSILPFLLFYAAWGLLDVDRDEFLNIASSIAIPESGYDSAQIGDRGGFISVGVIPVAVLLIALVLRLVLSRFQARLPVWTQLITAYAEVLWTFMLFTLVLQWWGDVRVWLDDRAGALWLQGFGDWFADNIPAIAVVWESGTWLVGILIAAVIIPAAWLAVAGVIYGTEFETGGGIDDWDIRFLRGGAASIARNLLKRLEDLWAAVAVIWRGGPLLFGATAVAYALWAFADQMGSRGILQLVGGHEPQFWEAFHALILVLIAAVSEPIRVAIIATAYDAVVARPAAGLDAGSSELDVEPGDGVGLAHVQEERPVGSGRHQEDDEDAVGR